MRSAGDTEQGEGEEMASESSRRYEPLQTVRLQEQHYNGMASSPVSAASSPFDAILGCFSNPHIELSAPAAFSDIYDEFGNPQGVSNGLNFASSATGSSGAVRSSDYDYLQSFMRNEMGYDEFMRLTGGQTIAEEMAAGDISDEDLDEEEELEDITEMRPNEEGGEGGEREQMEEEVGQTEGQPPAKQHRPVDDLPMHARIIMAEVINEGNSLLDSSSVTAQKMSVKAEPQPSTSADSSFIDNSLNASQIDKRDRGSKKAKILDSMLGQSNMMIAAGMNLEEAFEIIQEVIKQDHRNAEAYRQVSFFYGLKKDKAKYLQYGLLAAFLDNRTKAEDWCTWGNEAVELDMLQEASACYGKAIRLEPQDWQYYEKRIEIAEKMGIRPLSMRTRLQAAQMIDSAAAQVNFEFYKGILNDVASYYLMINDEERAMQALECLVIRSIEFDLDYDKHLDTLIGMLMEKQKYAETAKCIIALCRGVYCYDADTGSTCVQIRLENGRYSVEPYPLPQNTVIKADSSLPTTFLAMLTQCIILSDKKTHFEHLLAELTSRTLGCASMESLVLNIIEAFKERKLYKSGLAFARMLQPMEFYDHSSARFWFIKGQLSLVTGNEAEAKDSFVKCLSINPLHVDARISLSDLQQKAGDMELALETLRDVDFDVCNQLPDERLLIRQSEMLFNGHMTEKFIRTTRLLLIPHFYEVHRAEMLFSKRTLSRSGHTQSCALRERLLSSIASTAYEKFVKKLGAESREQNRPNSELTATDLHDYSLKLIEALLSMGRHQDALTICAYAYLQPKIKKTEKQATFQSIIFFLAVHAGNWNLAFEYMRWHHSNLLASKLHVLPQNRETVFKKVFNAMNFVFSNCQNVIYHRYVMRALAKSTGNHALHCISGNNSLITGSYKHALGEYLRVYDVNQKNPMICLLVGLTFVHMACKKDLSSKHLLAVKGLAFVKKYERMRTLKQECYYNIGRMFHQMGIIHMAFHYYEKALLEPPPQVERMDEEGNMVVTEDDRYDIRRFAAHNLAQIYAASGNKLMARKIYEQYLVVQ